MNTKITYALALVTVLLVVYTVMGRCEKYEEDEEKKKFKQNSDGTFYNK